VVLVFTVVLQVVIRPENYARIASDADRHASAQPSAEPAPARQANAATDREPAGKFEAPTTIERRVKDQVPSEPPASLALDRAKAAAPQPAPATQVEEPVIVAQSPAQSRSEEKAHEAVAPPPAAAARVSGALSVAQSSNYAPAVDAEKLQSDPKAWLAAIERLRKSGQAAAADRQMKLFLAKYPDYFRTHSLPDDAR
jgi:hypothetical protein